MADHPKQNDTLPAVSYSSPTNLSSKCDLYLRVISLLLETIADSGNDSHQRV